MRTRPRTADCIVRHEVFIRRQPTELDPNFARAYAMRGLTYRERREYVTANIRVTPNHPLVFRTAFHPKERASLAFTSERTKSPESVVNVAAGLRSYLEDLWIQCFWYELIVAGHSIRGISDAWSNTARRWSYMA